MTAVNLHGGRADSGTTTDREAENLVRRILDEANRILEPCGMAQGLSVGMVDMGLINGVDVERCQSGWDVRVRARVTSPDCLHFVYFERELRAGMNAIPGIRTVSVEWGDGSDWTPESMSATLREQLRERRQKRIQGQQIVFKGNQKQHLGGGQ